MRALSRYVAAISHLGPRQAALNLLHRARKRTRWYGRYARPGRGLEWQARARTPLLAHSGGSRLGGGRFTAIGRTDAIGDPPDWDRQAPLLWLYNLHYFGWLAELPSDEQLRLVLDWIERYRPSGRRPGWWPYPLSLRLRHWARGMFDGQPLAPERPRLLPSVEAQADCLADTLEHHLRGNHLLESAITLKLLAACVRGSATRRWGRIADSVLDAEIGEQFLVDGGHFERSPMYHALLLHGLLDLVNVLPDEDEQRIRLVDRMPGLLHFLAGTCHPDGEIALFNDAAFGIAPLPGELVAYAARLGFEPPAPKPGSFPETGYHVWRKEADMLVVDAGPIGPDYLSTHAHGDIFSYELSLNGRRVVVDGGTSTYEAGDERSWVRSTRAHNTVEIAGADQCEFFGAFRVGRRGRPHDVSARASDDGFELSAWHDGYRRLSGRPVHRRELAYAPEGALAVWDMVAGSDPHAAISRIRFAPGARVLLTGERTATIETDGVGMVVSAFGGVLSLELDHYAPHFGERTACPVLALHSRAGLEFGYALARRGLELQIDAAGAEIGGRTLARPGRRRPPAGAPA
jgi:uncharacterized heparinase superfamily protein